MALTLSEIRVGFHGDGTGTASLTWGQLTIWRTTQRTGRTMNLTGIMPLAEGSAVADIVALLRFVVSRHPALRTRLRFTGGPSADPHQEVAGAGEVPLEIADIGDGDDVDAAAEDVRSRYEFTPFDYENEFPVRMAVIRRSGAPICMVVGYSHIMVDGAGLNALARDLANLDRATGEATSPPPDLNTLALAQVQGSPTGRRQSERALQYWAAQLGRLPAWQPAEAQPQEPRFWELAAYSPAMELGMRAVSARTGTESTYVLLAAYSVASARVFGRSPGVAQTIVSNRFRPGFASLVAQVSQTGICVVDTEGASFDEIVARARKAVTSASFFGYYDPDDHARLLEETAARRGQPPDISWFLNDRRAVFTEGGDAGPPTRDELAQALPRTKLFWGRKLATFDGSFYLQVDSEPMVPERLALMEGLPAVYLELWTDTHQFALAQTEAFVREMEAVVVAAAFGAEVAAQPV